MVWWFVVNSLYHISREASSLFGSHHFNTYNGYYLILGGYQGIGELMNRGTLQFSNVIEDPISEELSGKTVSEIAQNIRDIKIK